MAEVAGPTRAPPRKPTIGMAVITVGVTVRFDELAIGSSTSWRPGSCHNERTTRAGLPRVTTLAGLTGFVDRAISPFGYASLTAAGSGRVAPAISKATACSAATTRRACRTVTRSPTKPMSGGPAKVASLPMVEMTATRLAA